MQFGSNSNLYLPFKSTNQIYRTRFYGRFCFLSSGSATKYVLIYIGETANRTMEYNVTPGANDSYSISIPHIPTVKRKAFFVHFGVIYLL